eukprot:CAMPEP_0184306070 /NCGR_PEP_ID=MMETSP1049-20130417/15164_1 /TAXON_ID=77928 /ORGANISM="Proteomonas sulcata, Strain CCMP704" /LENGTH=57 /DNA_ID=CAMNT_0026618253 /DNA_START=1062 /DNA_END=1232 /DNA_ORIENTATION=-
MQRGPAVLVPEVLLPSLLEQEPQALQLAIAGCEVDRREPDRVLGIRALLLHQRSQVG